MLPFPSALYSPSSLASNVKSSSSGKPYRRHSIQITSCPACPFKSSTHEEEEDVGGDERFRGDPTPAPYNAHDMQNQYNDMRTKLHTKLGITSNRFNVPCIVETSTSLSSSSSSVVSSLSTPSSLSNKNGYYGSSSARKAGSSHNGTGLEKGEKNEKKSMSGSQRGSQRRPLRRHSMEEDMDCYNRLQELNLSSSFGSGLKINELPFDTSHTTPSSSSESPVDLSGGRKSSTKKVKLSTGINSNNGRSKEVSGTKIRRPQRRHSMEEDMNCYKRLQELDLSNSHGSGLDVSATKANRNVNCQPKKQHTGKNDVAAMRPRPRRITPIKDDEHNTSAPELGPLSSESSRSNKTSRPSKTRRRHSMSECVAPSRWAIAMERYARGESHHNTSPREEYSDEEDEVSGNTNGIRFQDQW